MKHKLIIVDGPSTVGKSSISKNVYRQIARENKTFWLHEECQDHPIRKGEFSAGDIHSTEGMERNRLQMLNKWLLFSTELQENNAICVLEGCFLHALDRYILQSIWGEKDMMAFFGEIVELLQPLQPLVVFLHRPNLRLSFEKAFQARGERWRGIIMREPEPYGYFALHSYSGDESIFSSLLYEQENMARVFDSLSVAKLKIDTTDELWGHYTRQITESAGYVYACETGTEAELSKYCGKYQIEGGEAIWTIRYDEKSQSLYSSLFWPYMPMEYSGNDTLEFVSFPISLKFKETEDSLKFTVQGNYDWKYNGRTFKRLTSDEL